MILECSLTLASFRVVDIDGVESVFTLGAPAAIHVGLALALAIGDGGRERRG